MMNTDPTPVFAEERRQKILSLLEEKHKLYSADLCKYFQVSSATIRCDLRDLAEEGRLKRTHGGAISIRQTGFEPLSAEKETQHTDAKIRIAKEALSYVNDGDTIALDTGTTTLELARQLHSRKNLTVLVNDLTIACILEKYTGCSIIMLGGNIRHGLQCSIGPMTIENLMRFNVDKAFIATNAFSFQTGFMTPDLHQAEVKQKMLEIADQRFMLCDSSKLGKKSFVSFAGAKDIDVLITDSGITEEMRTLLDSKQEEFQVVVV